VSAEFELGQRVRFSHPMSRMVVPSHTLGADAGTAHYRGVAKAWQEHASSPPIMREGVIVGKRTLSNGFRIHEEYGYEFSPVEHFPAYLIVTDLRQKPEYVRPERIEAISAADHPGKEH